LKASGILSRPINKNAKVMGAVNSPPHTPEVLLTGPVENPLIRSGPITISRRRFPRQNDIPKRPHFKPPQPAVSPLARRPAPPFPLRPGTPRRPAPYPSLPQVPPQPHRSKRPVAPRPAPRHLRPLPRFWQPGWRWRYTPHWQHCECCTAILEMADAASRAIQKVAARYRRGYRRRRVY